MSQEELAKVNQRIDEVVSGGAIQQVKVDEETIVFQTPSLSELEERKASILRSSKKRTFRTKPMGSSNGL